MDRPIIKSWRKGNRFYVVEVLQDLFGNWAVKRSWGSISTNLGNSKTIEAKDYKHALKLLDEVSQRRKTRGYTHG